jgi:hypothetical protein
VLNFGSWFTIGWSKLAGRLQKPHVLIRFNPDGDPLAVQVACAPTGKPNVTDVMVTAFSTDRRQHGLLRAGKDVHDYIMKTTRID